jgi:hypothetical protein
MIVWTPLNDPATITMYAIDGSVVSRVVLNATAGTAYDIGEHIPGRTWATVEQEGAIVFIR